MHISEKQFTLLMMALDMAAKWALRQAEGDIDRLIADEEARTESLMSQLEGREDDAV